MAEQNYLLDNAEQQAPSRFASLEALFDPGTIRNLVATGIGPGWRCWEAGAGGGSVARWMAGQAGPSGYVLATDIDPRRLAEAGLPGVEVRQHDTGRDPAPDGEFDLVHARLVLVHIPHRAEALRQLVGALRPGGWLVLEDFDVRAIGTFAEQRGDEDALLGKVVSAFTDLLVAGGVDGEYGRSLPRLLEESGLIDVHAEGYVPIARGPSAVTDLHLANFVQTRDQLIAANLVTATELDRFTELLHTHRATLNLPMLVSARGRVPGRVTT
jgi:SAM-dependent methyltransferase